MSARAAAVPLSVDPRQRDALQYLLQANGIKEEDLQRPERVTQIEMVLDDYCCMESLSLFTHLKSVCLIQQAICKIEGLDNCRLLERLILNENRIRKLEGLHNCSRLKQLFICSNEIDEIGTGLTGLGELTTLWIAENQVTCLDGLEHVPSLTDLNAARNRLTSCVGAFMRNPQLQCVNLSDNRICSFREVLGLSSLPCLRELNLADPDWGENPICLLCNYQVFALYHLPALTVLDRTRVGEEEHQAAAAAFTKKRLYYNMRIKLVKRNATDGLRAARALDADRVFFLARELEAASKILRRGQVFDLSEEKNPSGCRLVGAHSIDLVGMAVAEKRTSDVTVELTDALAAWERLKAGMVSEKQHLIKGLMLELKTMGNLRMECGSPADAWVKSVEELVMSRFRSPDFKPFGVSNIRIQQVVRIHNRSLSIGFEQALDRMEANARRSIEYLFFVPAMDAPLDEIRAVAEEGFCGMGVGGAARRLLLTNSVSLVEVPRLEHRAASSAGRAIQRGLHRVAGVPRPATSVTCGGTLLLCSALLGDQRPDEPDTVSTDAGDLRNQWRRQPSTFSEEGRGSCGSMAEDVFGANDAASAEALLEGHDLCAELNPSPLLFSGRLGGGQTVGLKEPAAMPISLYRSREEDPKQRVWQVSQPDLVLPEYIVEFEYIYESEAIQSLLPQRKTELGPLAATFREYEFFAQLGMPGAASRKDGSRGAADEGELPPEFDPEHGLPQMQGFPSIEVLEAKHISPGRTSILAAPDPGVLQRIQVLDLQCRGLRRIEASALSGLSSLQVLNLAFNVIESLTWLSYWPSITHLDVAFNLVEKVDALPGVPALEHFDLSWNKLRSLDILAALARDTPKLNSLSLAGNPCAREPSYRSAVLSQLQSLRSLDEEAVTRNEVLEMQRQRARSTELSELVLMDRAFTTMPHNGGIGELDIANALESHCDSVTILVESAGEVSPGGRRTSAGTRVAHHNWRELVEFIDLKHLALTEVGDFQGFTKLRCLNLCSNQLTSLEPLAPCINLEELNVEDNLLSSLEGASVFQQLRRLDAGGNQIADVLDVQKLTKLTQLSLEDNYIHVLDAFSNLHNLMELYLSNNLIEQLRSILMLKQLTKLIVFDLLGNDLCSIAEYRRYTIFHLRRLKVLDGAPVSVSEQAEADEQLSGKLTMELLEEKLGASAACYSFRTVDLSNQNLREIGQLLNDDYFPSLRELNLDGNPFSDITQLGPLSKLVVLRLSRTKIDLERGMLAVGERGGGIAALPHLQVLDLGNSGISDLSHFEEFPLHSLRILHLPGNEITRIEGISHLEQLRELVLDRNKVKQFDEHSFGGLKSLRELHVEDNGLKSLANLGPLPRLRALYLSLNRIAELSELEKLRSLRHVLLIHLSQNPVARKPLYRTHVIHNMGGVRAIDGKEVTEDERDKVEQLLQVNDVAKAFGPGVYLLTGEQAEPGMANATSVGAGTPGLAAAGQVGGAPPFVSLAPKAPSGIPGPGMQPASGLLGVRGGGHPGGFALDDGGGNPAGIANRRGTIAQLPDGMDIVGGRKARYTRC